MSKTTTSETPVKFEILNLTAHRLDSDGRHYWAAEVTADGVRVGVDTVHGSWSVYEATDGAALTVEPGLRGTSRWECAAVAGLGALPAALQQQVHALVAAAAGEDDAPPVQRNIRRSR